MARKIVFKKHHKIGAGILIGLTTVVLILAFLVNFYWSPILAKKVKSVVLESSDSLYRADFSSAELHILRGKIILYNITLLPDTAVYNRRVKQHLAPNNLVSLHVKRLILDHIHPFTLYFKHRLDIGQIILSAPELDDSYQLNHTKDTVIKDHRTVWQKMSKTLHSVHIGQIFLNDVQLRYKDYSGNKVAISELKEMNLSASDLLIDSATQTDRSRLLYCKEVVAELNNYKGTSPSGLYNYKVNHLKLSTLTSQLDIEGLRLTPVNKNKFFDKTSKDRFDVYLDSVQLNHFDYLNYHKYRMVNAACITIKKGTFSLFSNPVSFNTPGVDNLKSFPHIALSKLTTDIKIDTLLVRHFDLAYSEYNKKAYQTGTITFNNTHGRFLNITNNKEALLKNNICTVQLNTLFLNKGELNVAFNFDLTAKDAAYSYKGNLGPMNLEDINPATMPFAMVKITSGTEKRLDFDIYANSKINKGKLTLLYNNLKVKVLSPDTNMNGFKGNLIQSLYANIFILKHNNPDKEGEAPRSFNINYVRPQDYPFFKTIWNTLLAGIKPSAGLDDKTIQATKAQKTQHQINKQNRLKKRAARKQRRAEKKRQNELEKAQKNGN